ncbi:MAG: hypothetical protein R8N23_05430 [Reichenbachiella sp.]|uniref:hypothetical protein n=1 Tax=Reichenbachiella sp. TaxID=2184521 RepID=UPI002966DCD1|nr:hypothetical protein [Reichenbachiella sp.]MDW3209285.1 hypothetical protein [Reichenbachiella sp.]
MKIDTQFFHEVDLQNALLLGDDDGRSLIEKELIPEALEEGSKIENLIIEKEVRLGIENIYIPDIMAFHMTRYKKLIFFDVHIFELKKDEVRLDALSQILRYRNYVEAYFKRNKVFNGLLKNKKLRFHCHLVGKMNHWTYGDSFYTMLYCQKNISIVNHTYELHPLNGLQISSFSKCQSIRINQDDNSLQYIENAIIEGLNPESN